MIKIQACKDAGEIISNGRWSKCKGPGVVWLEGSEGGGARVVNDEVRGRHEGDDRKPGRLY